MDTQPHPHQKDEYADGATKGALRDSGMSHKYGYRVSVARTRLSLGSERVTESLVGVDGSTGDTEMHGTSNGHVDSRRGVISLPVVECLSLVPHHEATPEIERLVFPAIPYLASVHCVTEADTDGRDYCHPHEHEDQDELNIFLGTTADFRFRITLDGADHILGPIAALLIPAGESHSANVVSGSGYYVVLKVPAQTQ